MRYGYIAAIAMLAGLLSWWGWQAMAHKDDGFSKDDYRQVNLVEFVDFNQMSEKMIKAKQRLMLKPEPISFTGVLKSRPKAGEFSLAYDALMLWQSDETKLPKIGFSAFIGAIGDENAPVLGVYVVDRIADILNKLPMEQPLEFYALHLYNYTKGPRLLIVGVKLPK